MKKSVLVFVLIIAVLALVSVSFAGPFFPSGDKTATGAIYVGKSTLGGGVVVTNDGVNDCTLKCYDASNAATGTALFPELVCQTANSQSCHAAALERACATGIYCVVTSSGSCTYGVGFRAGW